MFTPMTDEQFKAAKATMPWTERAYMQGRQTVIQVVDNTGKEVPLFTMTAFLTMITNKLVQALARETTNG